MTVIGAFGVRVGCESLRAVHLRPVNPPKVGEPAGGLRGVRDDVVPKALPKLGGEARPDAVEAALGEPAVDLQECEHEVRSQEPRIAPLALFFLQVEHA